MKFMNIKRDQLMTLIEQGIRNNPITALLGPRQCGKTTMARLLGEKQSSVYFDLENPLDQARLQNPMMTLEPLKGLIILDEIQCRPDLLALLRVLADRKPLPCRFLILGSASPELIRGSSETLAGRVHFVDMSVFSLEEVHPKNQERLWLRGGFPNSFLAEEDLISMQWRENYARTFLERDIPQLGIHIPPQTLRRFWTMVAHYHGQIWNSSEIAASLGIAHTTARKYLDLLSGAFVVRQLLPWFENMGKRVVKSPKAYIRDSGILHMLLNLASKEALMAHPKLGASWEGFALEQILSWSGERIAYFWATHGGAELDLMLVRHGKRWGFEFKCSDAPTMRKSMHIALEDLKLEKIWIIHPGVVRYSLHEKVECLGLREWIRQRDRLMV